MLFKLVGTDLYFLHVEQTLKAKVPTLVERMLMASTARSTFTAPHHELLSVVYRRPWDPVSAGIKHHKLVSGLILEICFTLGVKAQT